VLLSQKEGFTEHTRKLMKQERWDDGRGGGRERGVGVAGTAGGLEWFERIEERIGHPLVSG
jgi:hypothetical protein